MIDIAILGFGIVGSGVAEVIRMNQETIRQRCGQAINVKKIFDVRTFPDDLLAERVTSHADEILDDPSIPVIVETLGGIDIPFELSVRALRKRKHVVTSNKELVAARGPELMALAHEMNVSYMFEASVGGGIPIVRPLHKCLSANVIERIAGILNGTTNYILTRMNEGGIEFGAALAEAQAQGYAEKNPFADIDGLDSCRKIAILGSIAFGEYIDNRKIYTEGITSVTTADMAVARQLGYKIKLIGRFRRCANQTADLIVAPMLIERNHPIAVADDVNNAILVEGNALGEAMFFGRGAGRMPTASAVVADVIECVMHIERTPHFMLWQRSSREIVLPHESCQVRALLRLKRDISQAMLQEAFGQTKPLASSHDQEVDLFVGVDRKLTEGTLDQFMQEAGELVISRTRLF